MATSDDGVSSESTLRHAITRARLGVWDWDLVADTCLYSDSWFAMLGYRPDELVQDSETWLRLVHPDDRERAVLSGDAHISGDASHIESELRLRHKDGHYVWVLDRGGIVAWDEAGRPARAVGVQTDITRQKEVEADLAETNTSLRLALEAGSTGIWRYDSATNRTFWDERSCVIFGLVHDPDGFAPDFWQRFIHPDDLKRVEVQDALGTPVGRSRMLRYRIIRPDGVIRQVEALSRPAPHLGLMGGVLGTIRDVTDRVEAQTALKTEKDRYRVTLRAIRDAVISTDTEDKVAFANLAAQTLFGRSEAALIGTRMDDILSALPPAPPRRWADTPHHEGDLRLATDGAGRIRTLRCIATPIATQPGAALGRVITLQDITVERMREEELVFAARHDPLTGLLNRAAFQERLRILLAEAATRPVAVCYLDLDFFKAINDVAGHAAGDEALRIVARHVRSLLPEDGFAARLGGDEFAIALPAVSTVAIEELSQKLVTAIGSQRIEHRAGAQVLSASLGAAILASDNVDPADALAVADDACYASKAKGRNRWTLIAGNRPENPIGMTAARIVADLNDAKSSGRLVLFGQEIRDCEAPELPTGRIEVFTRLYTKDGTLIPPGSFVPAAERFGVAASIDRWVIRTTLQRHAAQMQGPRGLLFGFNLSAQTLSDPLLWDFVSHTLSTLGVPADRVVFEITETAAFTNFEAAERFIRLARQAGCRVSLDDFGAGLSSFSYLRKFRVDSIKIDGSFIENLTEDSLDCEIVAAIAGLAESLGYAVVAEKVSRPEALRVLTKLGIEMAQGFLLHRPEPLTDLVDRLAGGTLRRIAT